MTKVSVQPTDKMNEDANGKLEMTELKKGEKKDEKKKDLVSMLALFRFSTTSDKIMMVLGAIAAIGSGACFPILMLVFTSMIDSFTTQGFSFCSSNSTVNITSDYMAAINDKLTDSIREKTIYLIILALVTMVLTYFQISFWMMPAERQAKRMRNVLFSSILKQDIGWFDTYKSEELINRLTDDINKVKDGIGDKFGNAIQYIATFFAGIIIGFVRGWKLTLVILSLSPLLFISAALFTKLAGMLTTNELKSYAKAGAVAEEVFTAIRTVFAFNGAQKEHARYESKLDEARKFGIKKSIFNGLMQGFLWLVINGAYALGFWYGWTLTTAIDPATGTSQYSVGTILLCFFSILIGVFSLGNAAPFIGTLASSRAAAFEVFKIIDRQPPIDTSAVEKGEKINNLVGNIEFKDVHFNYPARRDVKILNGLCMNIKAGSTIALVGSSGCGKSTCIQLIQRFYDPLEGNVLVDSKSLKDLNLNWFRSQVGVVNQEPILFGTTIKENIRFGKDNVSEEEIITAAKNANAHDFIMNLPQKYETMVGDRGGQLSGGQKQRIAIARALVRDPRILLLDEATSALDNESESIVQAALDKARMGRTTIIVAHRLSTILNADVIYAFEKGQIAEFGTHSELMSRKGIYYNLVITQQRHQDESTTDNDVNNNDGEDLNNNNNASQNSKPVLQQQISKDLNSTTDKTLVHEKPEAAKKDAKKEKKKEPSMLSVLAYNKPEWHYILIGCIASIISGAVQPAFSIVFSKIIAVFQICSQDEQYHSIVIYCILFITFGVTTFISNFVQSCMFGLSGENLTKRLRSKGFQTMLKQEIGWYDDTNNNVGALCTRLAVEAAAVQGATGIRIGSTLMNLANFGIGLILSFVYGWAICLCILAFVPFMIISGVLQTRMLTGFSSKDKEVLEEAGKITNQAIGNIRTVVSLGKENYFLNMYAAKIQTPYKAAMRSAHIYGAMLGFTNSIMFYAIAASFSLGAYLIRNNMFGMTFERLMLVFGCISFGAQSVGQTSSLMPDYAKAKAAIAKMFELFERVPKINNWESTGGLTLSEDDMRNSSGNIELKDVEFRYPSRPEARVLKKLSIQIKKGQRVALVGSSGCGKSTITQLIERFYDPTSGQLTFCEKKTSDLNLFWLRSQIGIVSQEPILFDLSIAENIAYGDNSRKVSMEEIQEAAKLANIHDFITKLPKGYDTNVGSKGTQLSGGQKQRISIARALVRNPKILLLDEATSALDTESEKVVQEALEKAQEGRTCIIIAHRLSTIRNADVIFVLQNGVVKEMGTHDELINLNGFYAKLNGQQK